MSFRASSKTPSLTSVTMVPSFLVSDSRKGHDPKPIKREPTATVLVEATPLKPSRTMSLSQVNELQSQTAVPFFFSRTESKLSNVDEEEDFWDLPGSSSPEILSLTPIGNAEKRSLDAVDEETLASTPTKSGITKLGTSTSNASFRYLSSPASDMLCGYSAGPKH